MMNKIKSMVKKTKEGHLKIDEVNKKTYFNKKLTLVTKKNGWDVWKGLNKINDDIFLWRDIGLMWRKNYVLAGEDCVILIQARSEELTFIKDDVRNADIQVKDTSPIVYGKTKFLVIDAPPKNEKELPFYNPKPYLKTIEYEIGTHYVSGARDRPRVDIRVKDYKIKPSIIIDRFFKGSPFSPQNEKEDKVYSTLLKQYKDFDKACKKTEKLFNGE